LGDREGIHVCKKLGVGLLIVTIDWSFARLIYPVVTTISVILSFKKLANPGSSGNVAVKTDSCDLIQWVTLQRKDQNWFSDQKIDPRTEIRAKNEMISSKKVLSCGLEERACSLHYGVDDQTVFLPPPRKSYFCWRLFVCLFVC